MQPSQHAITENAVTQQPTMTQRNTHVLIAIAAVCAAVPAWAGSQPTQADAALLRAATTEPAAQDSDAAGEAERMRERIRQRLREQRRVPAQQAPYGTGYEARKGLGAEAIEEAQRAERVERVERPERVERAERPERVERPGIERAGRGGR